MSGTYPALLIVALLGTVLLTVDGADGPSHRREFWGAVLTVAPLMLIVILASLRLV